MSFIPVDSLSAPVTPAVVFVCPPVVDYLVGQGGAECHIGSCADGDPFSVGRASGIALTWIDADDANVLLLARISEQVRASRSAHARVCRAVPKHDEELSGLKRPVVAAIAAGVPIGMLGRLHHQPGAVVPILPEKPARQVEQTRDGIGPERVQASHDAGALRNVHGLVPVRLPASLELACDGVERLFPADSLEVPLAALSHALHRIVQPIRALKPAPCRTPSQACSHLRLPELLIAGVIGLDIGDLAVLHMALPCAE